MGNPGKRPLNSAEPRPPTSKGRTPRGLGDVAAAFYRTHAPTLAQLGILTKADEPTFRMAAIYYEVAERAYQDWREDGCPTEVEGRDGPRKPARLSVLNTFGTQFVKTAGLFGMNPSERSRLKVGEEEQLTLADILFGEAAVRAGAQAVQVDAEDEGDR